MFSRSSVDRCNIFQGSSLAAGLAAMGALAVAFGGIQAAAAAASPWARTDQSAVRLISPASGAGLSGTVRLGLQFLLKPGWKIYWRSPGDAGVPPAIDWTGSRNLQGAAIRWPLPERFTIFGLTTLVYGKQVVLPLDIRLKTPGQALALRAHVTYLACEKICIPYDARLVLDLAPGRRHRTLRPAGAIPACRRRGGRRAGLGCPGAVPARPGRAHP